MNTEGRNYYQNDYENGASDYNKNGISFPSNLPLSIVEPESLNCRQVYPLALPKSYEPLYRRVAAALEELIRRGCLRAGDQMPSLRCLSQRYRVSVPTVTQAYMLLEAQGILEVRRRSGFYLKSCSAASFQKKEVQKQNTENLLVTLIGDAACPDFVSFGLYSCIPHLFPPHKLTRALHSAVRKNKSKFIEYDLSSGNFNLRQKISKRSVEWGCLLGPEDIIITNGAIEALRLCLRAICQRGDTIAIESPMSPGVLLMLQELEIHAIEISCHPWEGMDISELGRLLSMRRVQGVLVTPNFHNPSGSLMPDRNKQALVELCTFHDTPIIEDDVHGDLVFNGPRPLCLKSLDRKDSIMLCGSFSRTLAPSYRVGYVAPGKFYGNVLDRKTLSTLCNATPPAMAIADFLTDGGYDSHLRGLRKVLYQQMHILAEAILKYFPAGTKINFPKGGAALWVELHKEIDSSLLCQAAREEKIGIVAGNAFSISKNYRNFIRIACSHPWNDVRKNALIRLGELAKHILHTGNSLAFSRKN